MKFPGQVNPPGWLMVCAKCGFIVDYDCGCDGPFSSRDYGDAYHFNSVDDAKNAATACRAELAAAAEGRHRRRPNVTDPGSTS